MRPFIGTIFVVAVCFFFSRTGPVRADGDKEPAPVTKRDAFQIVVNDVLGGDMEGRWVYVAREVVEADTQIRAFHRMIKSPPFDGWFFFIDDHPWANWAHPCRYVFVDVQTGEYDVVHASMPPDDIQQMERLTPMDVKKKVTLRHLRSPISPLADLTEITIPSCSDPENHYAVIISGGYNPYNNWVRYWNDCAAVYATLTQTYGYLDEHVYVLMADGADPGPDRHHYDDTYDSSPLDLDGDGDDDIEYAATREDISAVFNELQGLLGHDDSLFIFTTDHGSHETGQDAILILWGESITDDEFALEVDKIHAGKIMVVMEQCYSGGFLDDLSGPGRVVATATRYDELSWAMPPDYLHNEFVYYWTAAVRGERPDRTPVDADEDGDGEVSMEEAFIYARDHDGSDEHPQYSSNPADLGGELSLCGMRSDACMEDDTGVLDIEGKAGGPGATVIVPVRIQGAPGPGPVASLGFEVAYNTSILSYTGYSRGECVTDYDFFDVNEREPGLLVVGGFEAGGDVIPQGATCVVAYLEFSVIDCNPGEIYHLAELQNLVDDMAGWPSSGACFRCGGCDVNGDGQVTPKDALCAFQKYLGICPTDCGPCAEIFCDVNQDGQCTPADALEIFKCYLGLDSVCSPEECQ